MIMRTPPDEKPPSPPDPGDLRLQYWIKVYGDDTVAADYDGIVDIPMALKVDHLLDARESFKAIFELLVTNPALAATNVMVARLINAHHLGRSKDESKPKIGQGENPEAQKKEYKNPFLETPDLPSPPKLPFPPLPNFGNINVA